MCVSGVNVKFQELSLRILTQVSATTIQNRHRLVQVCITPSIDISIVLIVIKMVLTVSIYNIIHVGFLFHLSLCWIFYVLLLFIVMLLFYIFFCHSLILSILCMFPYVYQIQ